MQRTKFKGGCVSLLWNRKYPALIPCPSRSSDESGCIRRDAFIHCCRHRFRSGRKQTYCGRLAPEGLQGGVWLSADKQVCASHLKRVLFLFWCSVVTIQLSLSEIPMVSLFGGLKIHPNSLEVLHSWQSISLMRYEIHRQKKGWIVTWKLFRSSLPNSAKFISGERRRIVYEAAIPQTGM